MSEKKFQPDGANMPIVTGDYARENPVDASREPRIVVPDTDSFERIKEQMLNPERCGLCYFFRLRQGQERLNGERMFERAVREQDWNKQWFGDPRWYGICSQWGDHATTFFSPSNIPSGFLDSSLPPGKNPGEYDYPAPCPSFKPRGKGGMSSAVHYIGKKRNYEE